MPKSLPEAIDATIAWLQSNPDNRAVGDLALNGDGTRVAVDNPDATCFCTVGYLAKEMGRSDEFATRFIDTLPTKLFHPLLEVMDVNDANRPLPAIIAALKDLKTAAFEQAR